MPSAASENGLVACPLQTPPKLTDPLPCPRCISTNTKFCYYNNYNLSQPRHFCKGCRRYWTHGGTLRNIPVGGGTRKAKRSRSSNSTNSPSSSSTTTTTTTTCNSNISTLTNEIEPLPVPVTTNTSLVAEVENGDHQGLGLIEKKAGFSAMLNTQGHGFADPYVYGFSLCEMGVGFSGRGVWNYPGLSYIGGGVGNGEGMGIGSSGCNTWQYSDVGSGGEGLNFHGESDSFAWPGLAMSAPGKLSFK